jgi:predicted RNase H-like HicB family nuclease
VKLTLFVQFSREGKYVLADCPTIGVHAFGKSVEDAKTEFKDALVLFLETAHKNNQLERVRKKIGTSSKPAKAWNLLKNSEYVSPVEIPAKFAHACSSS